MGRVQKVGRLCPTVTSTEVCEAEPCVCEEPDPTGDVARDGTVPPADVDTTTAKVAEYGSGVVVKSSSESVLAQASEPSEFDVSSKLFSGASEVEVGKVEEIADVWCVHAYRISLGRRVE